jgi:hypothetical protein
VGLDGAVEKKEGLDADAQDDRLGVGEDRREPGMAFQQGGAGPLLLVPAVEGFEPPGHREGPGGVGIIPRGFVPRVHEQAHPGVLPEVLELGRVLPGRHVQVAARLVQDVGHERAVGRRARHRGQHAEVLGPQQADHTVDHAGSSGTAFEKATTMVYASFIAQFFMESQEALKLEIRPWNFNR